MKDLVAAADLEQFVLLQILVQLDLHFLALVKHSDGGAGDTDLLTGIDQLGGEDAIISDHTVRRFGFPDLIFAQIQLSAFCRAICGRGQRIDHIALGIAQRAVRREHIFGCADLEFRTGKAAFSIDRGISAVLFRDRGKYLAGLDDLDLSFLRGIRLFCDHKSDAVSAFGVFCCDIEIHRLRVQHIPVGCLHLDDGIPCAIRQHLRRDEPASVVGHKTGVRFRLRVGGVHLYQLAVRIVDLKGSTGVRNDLAGFSIDLDDLQIGFEFSIVDEILIGLSVLGDLDGKGRHQLAAIPALGLLHHILAVGQRLALGKTVIAADKHISLVRIGGVIAAGGFEINLELSTGLRCFDLGAAVIRMLDDGDAALDDILAHIDGNGVVLQGEVSGLCADGIDRFVQKIADRGRDLTERPAAAAHILLCRKAAGGIGFIGVNQNIAVIDAIHGTGQHSVALRQTFFAVPLGQGHAELFKNIAEFHDGSLAADYAHGLALLRHIAVIRKLRDGIFTGGKVVDLDLTVFSGLNGFVHPIAGDREADAGHNTVLGGLDDLGAAVGYLDMKVARNRVVHRLRIGDQILQRSVTGEVVAVAPSDDPTALGIFLFCRNGDGIFRRVFCRDGQCVTADGEAEAAAAEAVIAKDAVGIGQCRRVFRTVPFQLDVLRSAAGFAHKAGDLAVALHVGLDHTVVAEDLTAQRMVCADLLGHSIVAAGADMRKVRISFANDCFPDEKLRCNGIGQLIGSLILTSP